MRTHSLKQDASQSARQGATSTTEWMATQQRHTSTSHHSWEPKTGCSQRAHPTRGTHAPPPGMHRGSGALTPEDDKSSSGWLGTTKMRLTNLQG